MAAPRLGRRLASLLYEWLVFDAIALVVIVLFSLVVTAAPALPHQRPLLLALCFVVPGLYFAYCWHNGQTLAMRAWRIRIEDTHGQPVGWGRACIRYVITWVWSAPPLAAVAAFKPYPPHSIPAALSAAAIAMLAWAALWSLASMLREDRQFLHDVAAGTRLVDA